MNTEEIDNMDLEELENHEDYLICLMQRARAYDFNIYQAELEYTRQRMVDILEEKSVSS